MQHDQHTDRGTSRGVGATVIDRAGFRSAAVKMSDFGPRGCSLIGAVMDYPDEVEVAISGLHRLKRARIVWRRKDRVGVEFLPDMTIAKDRRNEKRTPVHIAARLAAADNEKAIEGTVIDISPNGCRFEGTDAGRLPDRVVIHVPQLGQPLPGQIVWRVPGMVGIRLLWSALASHRAAG